MAYSPRMKAAMQARFEKLSARPNLNPAQQRSMDRLGGRLGVGQATPVQQITGMGSSNPTPGGRPLPLGPAQGGPISDPVAVSSFQGSSLGGGSATGTPANFSGTPASPPPAGAAFKRGGKVNKIASGGMISKPSSASRRGDGIAQRGKTKGRVL